MNVSRRGFLKEGAATSVLALGMLGADLAATAHAAAPLKKAPQFGAIRRKLGDFEVTALLDGYIGIKNDQISGYDAKIAEPLRQDAFISTPDIPIPVSAYLINTGKQLILVDAGTADGFGPTLGQMEGALAAAGVKPEQIDAILITHLHPDHVYGLLKKNGGGKLFPKAQVIVPEVEYKFWHDDANIVEPLKHFIDGARRSLKPYEKTLTKFIAGKEVVPGITSVPLPGHTPGHTGYIVSSGGQSLFITADLIHVGALQFAQPEWSLAFDMDKDSAVKIRKRTLDQIQTEKLFIAGMHLPFPGFGHVLKHKNGYRFAPAEWQYT